MAKKVIWTLRSIQDRIQIYRYWEDHNQSDSYSAKRESLFNITADLILRYPEIGTTTSFPDVRVKVVKSYKIFYRVLNDRIEILRGWDSHQNPKTLNLS